MRSGMVVVSVILSSALVGGCSVQPDVSSVKKVETARRSGFALGVSMGDRLRTMPARQMRRALDDVVDLDAAWVRMDLPWAALQPDARSPIRWAAIDRVVEAAAERRLQIVGIVAYTPAWARSAGCDSFTCPPVDVDAFSAFARQVSRRYPTSVLRAIEVWNEPNLDMFWRDPDPIAYRNLLVRTLVGIKEERPARIVLLGGLAPVPGRPSIDASTFLREACAADACAGVDGIAYHPYSSPWLPTDPPPGAPEWHRVDTGRGVREGLREAAAQVGLEQKPFWFTEFGAPTSDSGVDSGGEARVRGLTGQVEVSEAQQGRIVSAGIKEARRGYPGVAGLFVYTWRDLDVYGDAEDSYGLRRLDGTPKPAWSAFRDAAR